MVRNAAGLNAFERNQSAAFLSVGCDIVRRWLSHPWITFDHQANHRIHTYGSLMSRRHEISGMKIRFAA